MSKIPDLSPSEGVQKAKNKAKGLISWLPDPYTCDECGSYCRSDVQYVESQAMPMPVWDCPNCGSRYFREEGNPLKAEMWD